MPFAALQELGRPFWIVFMILGFMIWWPVGLAILAFLAWSRKMACWGYNSTDRWQRKMDRWQQKMDFMRERMAEFGERGGAGRPGFRPSGNNAFDAYRAETLKRLEEEQQDFQGFLDRLRDAKDKAEFDQFMADRRTRPAPTPPEPYTPQA